MSKPFAPKRFVLASWIFAVVALAAVAVVASGHTGLRALSGSVNAKPVTAAHLPASALSPEQRGRVRANLGALPLAFEANQGQTDPQVKYMARGNGYTLFLTANDAVFALHSPSPTEAQSPAARRVRAPESRRPGKLHQQSGADAVVRMQLVGGNSQATIEANDRLDGKTNYFIGNDPSKWQKNVAQYARVSYRDVYPGVNLAYYGVQRQLEFDFIVAPGASPASIRFGVSGASKITTDAAGNLLLASTAGDVHLHKPVAYQQKNGTRQPVDARFILQANNQVSFELGNYDRSRELVIDPSVSYATYLGGSLEDDAYAIAIDGSGNAYVTGQTKSTDFPTVGGVAPNTNAGGFDVFVTEISPDGSSLVYSTYVGGSGDDSGNAIAVDGSGDAFVAGGTGSNNFPHTTGAFQTSNAGGKTDAFVFELHAGGGTLTLSTYLGGTGDDVANGVAIDSTGIYVVGTTTSTNFPTINAKQPNIAGASNGFVTKFNTTASSRDYSTYLGGGTGDLATAVAVDSSNHPYVTGATQNSTFPTTTGAFQTSCGTAANCNGSLDDAFVTVYKADGSGYVYSTFLGGENADQGFGIAVDSAGDAYVTGATASTLFPVKSAVQGTLKGGFDDAFVSELNPTGSALVFSTYLGGSANDVGTGIALDGNGKIYVTGGTASSDFPTVSATQGTYGGANDAFVSEYSASGASLVFSTYLGGSGSENAVGGGSLGAIAVDSTGANIYVAGNTASNPFPTTTGAKQTTYGGGTDAFVAKYSTSGGAGNFTVADGALSTTSGAPGVSATSTITVTSSGGFNSAVALACAVTPFAVEGPTCAFSNPGSSVTPPANGSVTATLTVSTTPASSAHVTPPADGRAHGVFYATFLPIGGIALLGAGLGSRRRKLFGFLLLGLLLAGLMVLPGCSSSSGGSKGNGGTPAGNYTITVTGTAGGTSVQGSPTLSLNIT